MTRTPRSATLAGLTSLVLGLGLGGCAGSSDDQAVGPGSSAPTASSPTSAPGTPSAPAEAPTDPTTTAATLAPAQTTPAPTATGGAQRSASCTAAAPDPNRPVVRLAWDVPTDRRVLTGRQAVKFTPDRPTERIVFRLWGNAPRPRAAGGFMRITSVYVDRQRVTNAVLSQNHTQLTIPLSTTSTRTREVLLTFQYALPQNANERMGRDGTTAWWASAAPLLAWERGRGWAIEPPTSVFAEASTSEAANLHVSVTTASTDVVLATGSRAGVTQVGGGRVRHLFTSSAARDSMVAVGRFRVATARAGNVVVRAGVAPGLSDSPQRIADLNAQSINAHAARLGPFPYPTLDVAVVPDISGGIEYPAAILLGTGQDRDATLSHEVAHEYFYSLVGNNQGRDPWLDESFATYAEALHRGTSSRYLSATPPPEGRNRVGQPMTYWERYPRAYHVSVYSQGAAGLLRARSRVGAATFDAAIRCYVATMSHRIATPADLQRSLQAYPAAIEELRKVGALR
jgi:hypothetical protein